ncbi:MAG: ABC transporter ATP-binding protein [Actinomycetia bacterium]|nr:ABC transporter ATP-binding protein [Actinomycetes bacterium]
MSEGIEPQAAVVVEDVSMVFNIANEQLNSLKEYMLKLVKRELFFKEFCALKNISLQVEKGDVFGIVGVNGSGKSTLLKIVAGVLEPTRGSCTVRGTIAPLIELGAGFDLELTARENIFLNGSLLGYSRLYIKEHFDEIVEFADLWEFLELPMKNYSSGMIARIAFAIATVIVPDVLIVDETLAVGDMFFQEKCEARINTLIQEYGTTVLFVSHDINQVERICERAVWIEKGHQQMLGTVDEVCEAYRMREKGAL